MKSLAICAIVRDEAPHIAEWIEFHRLVGVSRFFIYDDRSQDNTLEIVRRHAQGDVTIHHYAEGWHSADYCCPVKASFGRTPQICAYNHFARHHAGDCGWCAYIDIDEFLYHFDPKLHRLPNALEPYEPFCGVAVNWLVFGSSGHVQRPTGTIEHYTRRGEIGQPHPYGRHVKCIVRGDWPHYWGPWGSHAPIFAHKFLPVDAFERPIHGATTTLPIADKFRINHYYHRSADEAAAKSVREDRNAVPGFQPDANRLKAHDCNHLEDRTILRYLPQLKESLSNYANAPDADCRTAQGNAAQPATVPCL